MRTIFGPVPSRRLGRSLGIDVIPPKTCTHDCIYCESGHTTCLTLDRKAFVEPERVLRDLDAYFGRYPNSADVLTFSSAGEPTLYEPLGDLIRAIKKKFPALPLIVLTNGALLFDPRVRKDLARADRVVPSLDAVSDEVFQRINRPHPGIGISMILEGLEAFRREYKGRLHVEVMMVSGVNDHPHELKEIGTFISRLGPDEVELNTVVRPPADHMAESLSPEAMCRASTFFPHGITRIIGAFHGSSGEKSDESLARRIMGMVRRRPCTLDEMAASLGVTLEEARFTLRKLEESNRIVRYSVQDREFICHRDRT